MLPRIPGLHRQQVDPTTWLVSRGEPTRRVRRLGPAKFGVDLVYDPQVATDSPGRFERVISDFLSHQHVAWMLRELRIDLVIDVGGNKGQFARSLRKGGYRGRIVTFEPLPHLAERLRRKAARDGRWEVHECALGDADGTSEINVVDGGMSSLLPSSEFGRAWSGKLAEPTPVTITIRRLEDLWDDVVGPGPVRPYLKLDTQGFDLEAFRGAGAHVSQLLGMQSEVSCVPIYDGMPRLAEQLTTYEAAGFETTGLFQVSRDRATMRVIEFDLVMIGPAGLAERAGRRHHGPT